MSITGLHFHDKICKLQAHRHQSMKIAEARPHLHCLILVLRRGTSPHRVLTEGRLHFCEELLQTAQLTGKHPAVRLLMSSQKLMVRMCHDSLAACVCAEATELMRMDSCTTLVNQCVRLCHTCTRSLSLSGSGAPVSKVLMNLQATRGLRQRLR